MYLDTSRESGLPMSECMGKKKEKREKKKEIEAGGGRGKGAKKGSQAA